MALRTVITERQRRFGAELRLQRELAELGLSDAAAGIDMRAPQLNHVEAARTSLAPDRVRELLKLYGCNNATYVDALLTSAAQSGRGWWSGYKESLPAHALDLAEMESVSRKIDSYETFYIPGLLQTEGYMRALYEHRYGQIEGGPDVSIRFRKSRQRILTAEDGPEFRFIIHEAALRLEFAGRERVRRQLLHLLTMASRPNVRIWVLPFSVNGSSPYPSPFYVCEPDAAELSTIGIDHPSRVDYLTSPAEIQSYRQTFDHLLKISLPEISSERPITKGAHRNSRGLIQSIITTYERRTGND